MKKIIILGLIWLCCACAAKTSISPQSSRDGELVLERFVKLSEAAADKPYRIQLSLRFGEEGDTRRITAILWGQDNIVRLDAMAGVGAIIAKIRDENDRFLLFIPQEHKAYEHSGNNKPLLRIGTPLPFNLIQLAALLNGNYEEVFGRDAIFQGMSDQNFEFKLNSNPGGILVINGNGAPVKWQNNEWRLSVILEDDNYLPHSVRLVNKNGRMAVLLVKEREVITQGFTNDQMDLALPAGVEILPLSAYKQQ